MDMVVLGIDLGKNSCSLAGLDASGRVVLRRRLRRDRVERFVGGLALHRGDGGVLRRAPSGPASSPPRATRFG